LPEEERSYKITKVQAHYSVLEGEKSEIEAIFGLSSV
jgi:hypothetical protein